jgi:DNA polymerase (family 10)
VIVEPVVAKLRARSDVLWAEPAGELRRGLESIAALVIVAPAVDPRRLFAFLPTLEGVSEYQRENEREARLVVDRHELRVHTPHPSEAGLLLLRLTGSDAHLSKLGGLETVRSADTEDAIYREFGLPWIPPELREGADEIDAALGSRLPLLIALPDVRGDLHMHTKWSDGRDSIETMVAGCAALGYAYLAITDHSPSAASSKALSADDVARQAEEIAAVREQHPGMTILHGCEADILPDGRLDFSDDVLDRFDIVLASLHDRHGDSSDRLLERYLIAMADPRVSIITHPTNRQIPHRRGYDLEYDRLFEAAVESGTAVEIDGAPSHLDLTGELARRAIAAGATLVIDGDSHAVERLALQMDMGITMARRGWVEPVQVLNTGSIERVRAFIAAKRHR